MSQDLLQQAKASQLKLKEMIAIRLSDDLQQLVFRELQNEEELKHLMVQMPKLVGSRPLIAQFGDRNKASIDTIYGKILVGEWTLVLATRIFVLSQFYVMQEDAFQKLYAFYDSSDTEVRQACLTAINFIHGSQEDALVLIYDAGRTYLSALMSSAWCNHPFSANALSEQEYHKAVLKALFCDIPVSGFSNLNERATPALAQSLCEYADEREAAGRIVPPAVWVIAAHFPKPGLVARLIGRLEHPSESERATAIDALANAKDMRALSFLEDRLQRESVSDLQVKLSHTIEKLKKMV